MTIATAIMLLCEHEEYWAETLLTDTGRYLIKDNEKQRWLTIFEDDSVTWECGCIFDAFDSVADWVAEQCKVYPMKGMPESESGEDLEAWITASFDKGLDAN